MEWETSDIPLHIQKENGRVVISHKYPNDIGEVAQLKLSPKLAYILGYNEHEYNVSGQTLRFDEEGTYIAPHDPKSFLQYEKLAYLEMLGDEVSEQIDSIGKKIENRLKNIIKTEFREVIEDSLDRQSKGVSNLLDFEKLKDLESWLLKVSVVKGESVTLKNDETIFILTLKDHTCEVDVTGFGKHGEVLKGLASIGRSFYIERVYDWDEISHKYYVDNNFMDEEITQNNVTITIFDETFRVKFEDVM